VVTASVAVSVKGFRRLADVPRTLIENEILPLARISRPAVLSCAAISQVVFFRDRGRPPLLHVPPMLVYSIIRHFEPELLASRRVSRERTKLSPIVFRFDGRVRDCGKLDGWRRALLFAKARVFVLDVLGRAVPAWTLAEIGRLFAPRGFVLSRDAVRRVLLALPGGRELLRERLRARRAAARQVPRTPRDV
jgi:hypothetical protein